MNKKKIVIAVTGASGSEYALNLLEKLKKYNKHFEEIAIVFSETGKEVYQFETGKLPALKKPFRNYNNSDLFAGPASGSARYEVMAVIPCSMGTLARIASGNAQTLIERTADVMLKERRKLILVTRETPLSLIHIRNMETVSLAGGIILPASPSFYRKPATINDLVDSVTERVMSFLLPEAEGYKWGQ